MSKEKTVCEPHAHLPPTASPRAGLRERAEIRARESQSRAPQKGQELSLEAQQRIICELEIYQIELEMQNEELRRAQAELDIQRAKYFDLYDLAPVGYLTLNERGLISEANLTIATLLGVARSTLPQQPFTRFIMSEDQDVYYRHRKQLFAMGEPQECELRMHSHNGAHFWAHLRAIAAQDADGAPTCRVIVSDISERKRLHASLAHADRLASMGTLAAGVGHEINNPLTYVLSNVENLSEDLLHIADVVERFHFALNAHVGSEVLSSLVGSDLELPGRAQFEDAAKRAEEARDGALRIKEITRALRTFCRGDRDGLYGVDLAQPIESAVKMMTNEIKHRARLVTDLGAVPEVWASEGSLAQVFLNLLQNATQAIEEGHVDENLIRIRTWLAGDSVFAEVSDTGCGIPPENMERIFEPFFTNKEVGKGSGLGLSICRNIVTQLGGDILVQSEAGKGTTFVVRLPAKPKETISLGTPVTRVAAETLPVAAETMPVAAETLPLAAETLPVAAETMPIATEISAVPVRGGRILVVDDEEIISTMLARLFEREHSVVSALSGRDARAILEKDQQFNVILCDVMMPDVTGIELHQWLVQHNPRLAARMVFMTGGVFTSKAESYLNSVRTALIEKPFDIERLVRLVDGMIA